MNLDLNAKVIGGGATGALLSLALCKEKLNVSIFENQTYESIISRDRVYAITHSSRRLFQKLNIWSEIREYLNPFNSLIIEDSIINKKFLLETKDLSIDSQKYNAIGWTIDHKELMNFLFNKLGNYPNIKLYFDCKQSFSDDNIGYDYYFAADGLSSLYRTKWNIKRHYFRYHQACVTFKIILRGDNLNQAYEIFKQDGPMAILPVKAGQYQIVLSSSLQKCEQIINLSTSRFFDYIAPLFPSHLEVDQLVNQPQSFPLCFSLARNLRKGNKFLLGESAHSLHPVGGQGLNLSIRDIDSIITMIYHDNKNNRKYHVKKINRDNYSCRRYIDIIVTSLLTDSLVRFFSNKNTVLTILRRLVFIFLIKFTYLRKIILSIMTDGILDIKL
ncbi:MULTISPECIES: FAD-dependent monooxygenase [unclassified Prochlorococcus]|uniref:FAD-dependent monooxygenase n=1 Tax=unclassified Prochlorococcus TaxID=2627481 RepID=UPI0005339092|nr:MULTISPECIES: FAD-dependent monooxygenase [unclassified Prochlorococcus]KGG15226.1 2-octaprenyl-6-methoxyphenol hydroxylase [Prochlorococcus sp. MIT 0602]KGG17501.1 2-octaprenyl-6-methoxyphenol hydroxylase [Prochlorococcus sp. MIT 0603]